MLSKINNQWTFRNRIAGFDYSSKYFEIMNNLNVFVSHEYKGVYSLIMDQNFQNITVIEKYKEPKKGKNASLTKFNNNIYYAYKEGIFKLNSVKKQIKCRNLVGEFLWICLIFFRSS